MTAALALLPAALGLAAGVVAWALCAAAGRADEAIPTIHDETQGGGPC